MAEEEQAAPPQTNTMQKMISYTKSTRKGTILMAEIMLCIIVIICFAVSSFGYYIMVGVWELISTIIIFVIFSLEFQNIFNFINFPWTDFFRAISSCLIFLIISILCVARQWTDSPQIVGGIFGFVASLLYGHDTYLILSELRASKDRSPVIITSV